MRTFNDEYEFNEDFCLCKNCGCYYDVFDNNEYGFLHHCSQCGEDRHENFVELSFQDVMTELVNVFKIAEQLKQPILKKKKQ